MPPEDAQEVVNEGLPESTPGTEGQQPDIETHDGEQVEGQETPASDDAGAHRSKGVERRIGQLTRRYRESEREKKALQGRLDALEQRVGPPPEPTRPKTDDFETPEDYEDALFEWRDATRAHKTSTEVPQQTQEQQAFAESAAKIEQDLEVLSELHPDAVEAVLMDDWPCNDSTYEFISNSEKGAELAYYLATNQVVADKVNGLTPVMAARELIKIEAELSAKKPSVSPPPPPGEPVTPSGSSVVTDPDKMSPQQWRAWREGEIAKRA